MKYSVSIAVVTISFLISPTAFAQADIVSEACAPYAVHANNQVVPQNKTSMIQVYRRGDTSSEIRVNYSIVPIDAEPEIDYRPTAGELVFSSGKTSAHFYLPIRGQGNEAPPKTLQIVLTGPGTQPPATNGIVVIEPGEDFVPSTVDSHISSVSVCLPKSVRWGGAGTPCFGSATYGVHTPTVHTTTQVINENLQYFGYMVMRCAASGEWLPLNSGHVLNLLVGNSQCNPL